MGKFLCGVVLGASVMGISVWAGEYLKAPSVTTAEIKIDNGSTDLYFEPVTSAVTLAECMYKKDGVWYPVTHVDTSSK